MEYKIPLRSLYCALFIDDAGTAQNDKSTPEEPETNQGHSGRAITTKSADSEVETQDVDCQSENQQCNCNVSAR
jgi:hypothetical protein